jgi:branched-chain amino acid transport system ATP-binding protein
MLLSIENLEIHYEGAEIVKGISLHVLPGEIVTLIGSNGAGKTTALRSIVGLKRAQAGEIQFKGKPITQASPQQITREGISLVPEGRGLFPFMSVKENLQMGAFIRKNRQEVRKDLTRMEEAFPVLRDRSGQNAGTLSGGEQQMLAMACALMARPELLILDEPSTGLSPLMVGKIGKIISEVNRQGTSVLLVEQNARLALGLSRRGYVLETGLITLEGKAEELRNSDHVRKAYLGE